MKTQIVSMCLWDLEFIIDSKKKIIEKAFWDIDILIKDIQKEKKLKLSDVVYISVFPDIKWENWSILLATQALVNDWYKHIYKKHHKVNFWIK